MALDERLKQRLLGGAVLVALVVIFVPMLIDEPVDSKLVSDHRIPPKPEEIEKALPAILPPPPEATEAPSPVAIKPPVAESTERSSEASRKPPEQTKRKPPVAWVIQVASLTVEKNAQKLVTDLRKADLPAQLQTVEVDGKRHYRVRVGPEVNHQTALKMAERVKREFKLTPKVLQYSE
jgi:DedD protein